jgi:hypothetical protein
MRRLPAIALGLLAGLASAQAPTPVATREIEGLFAALAASDCRFQRNGRWYDATRATKHLRRKFDWLRERELVPDAENFIARAATRSSLSGEAYRVQCGEAAPRASADWFGERLQQLRAVR